jgi:hypothetical protein
LNKTAEVKTKAKKMKTTGRFGNLEAISAANSDAAIPAAWITL